mmetsp:Transcript_18342/g.29297  ORF Transcript_18342/g.29297 Transcript_18342/m.29297 type:complete len:110 (-) Transcript_18342:449-778(-)
MVCIEYRFFVATQESSEKLSSHDDISLMTEELSSHDGVVSRTHERVMSDTCTSHDSGVLRLSSHDGAFLLAFAAFAPLLARGNEFAEHLLHVGIKFGAAFNKGHTPFIC